MPRVYSVPRDPNPVSAERLIIANCVFAELWLLARNDFSPSLVYPEILNAQQTHARVWALRVG